MLPVIEWLQAHELPCLVKQFAGIDCPTCGFQRSMIALLQGNFSLSWHFFPPMTGILLVLIYLPIHFRVNLQYNPLILKMLLTLMVGSIFVNYIFKFL